MNPSRVRTEPDPVPIVLVVATILRRSELDPKRAALLTSRKGTVVLRSTTDPQAATMRFDRSGVLVERGVAADADVVIAADLATMGEPGAPAPKVSGAFGHLRLALAVGKLLEPELGEWPAEAERYWAWAAGRRGMPRGLKVVGLDDGRVVELGATPAEYEVHGTAFRLQKLFSGGAIIGEEVFAGRLYGVGSLPHLAELTGSSIDWMMGR